MHADSRIASSTKENLAIAIMNQGKFKKAIKIEKEVEESLAQNYGPDNPMTQKSRSKLERMGQSL